MGDRLVESILDRIISNPATAYFLSFGGLGVVLLLALNGLHRHFILTERTWGLLTLATGAVGGVLLQAGGLVTIPGTGMVAHVAAAFAGAATASAAAGFSAIDLRKTLKPQIKE